MNFKEQLERDLNSTFYHCTEFADVMEFWIDGMRHQTPVVIDNILAKERENRLQSDHADGIQHISCVMRVPLSSIGTVPKQGGWLLLEHQRYKIQRVDTDSGEVLMELKRLDE